MNSMIMLFPIGLFLLAAGLMLWHLRSWREVREREKSDKEREFQSKRFRRRMQSSGMLVLIAVMLAISARAADMPDVVSRNPQFYGWFLVAALFLLLWVVGLAIADGVASRLHFSSLERERRIQQATLEAQVRRAQESLGKPGPGE